MEKDRCPECGEGLALTVGAARSGVSVWTVVLITLGWTAAFAAAYGPIIVLVLLPLVLVGVLAVRKQEISHRSEKWLLAACLAWLGIELAWALLGWVI